MFKFFRFIITICKQNALKQITYISCHKTSKSKSNFIVSKHGNLREKNSMLQATIIESKLTKKEKNMGGEMVETE